MAFFEGYSWFKFNNLGLAPGTRYQILHQCGKRIKTKSQNVLGAKSYICKSYRQKTGGVCLFVPPPTPILNRVKTNLEAFDRFFCQSIIIKLFMCQFQQKQFRKN